MKNLDAQTIIDENLSPVWREADDSWRHGSYITEVYKREEDDTYWMAQYRLSTDGETDELREGFAVIQQCWPKTITTVAYTTKAVS